MKLMIASDIHGSAAYCELLLQRMKKEDPERLLLLGDLLYHGPRNDLPERYDPREVIGILNGIKDRILCIRGNCDCDVDQMVLEFPIMADYALLYLDGTPVYVTHGHIHNPKNPLPGMKGILLCGHTHIPVIEEYEGFTCLNPGSVSIPKNGTRHSYMVYEDGLFCWKDLITSETYMEFKTRPGE